VLAATAVSVIAAAATGRLLLATVALFVWLASLGVYAKPVLKRVWRPKLWIASLVLAAGSGLLLGDTDLRVFGVGLSTVGLAAGAWMIVRGVLLITLASLVASTLSRGEALRWLARFGLPGAAGAVHAAVAMLPRAQERMVEAWAESRSIGGGIRGRLARIDHCCVLLAAEAATLSRHDLLDRSDGTTPGDGHIPP
jgi:energy-coupling factor transporter transmembrane protein EcfT